MQRNLREKLGTVLWWLCLPAYMVYFRLGERTRVLIISEDGTQVLVLRTWVGNGQWNLPGGGLHRREDPAMGAAREVLEETGISLRVEQLVSLGLAEYRMRGIVFTYHMFAATGDVAARLIRQRREIAAVAWVPAADINEATSGQEVMAAVAAARTQGLLQ